ncbi:hypothetical protein C9439_07835 [archaeon SCG-AAA382B04]|nr:hypothetical protein C9439_07835 [archaeon SCG-AAA382B04]
MKTLAVTRPKNSLKESKKIVDEFGFDFYAAPTIDLFPKESEDLEKLKFNIKQGKADFVIFTSKNGTRFFFEELGGGGLIEELNKIRTIAIGPKTAKKLKKYLDEVEVPKKYSSSGLVNYLSGEVKGKIVEIARSSHGSEILVEGLEQNNAIVHDVSLYEIGLPKDTSKIKELIEKTLNKEIDVLTFTSKMTFVNFMKVAQDLGKKNELIEALNDVTIAAIGEPTKSKINEYGVSNVVAPQEYTFKNMINTVVKEN